MRLRPNAAQAANKTIFALEIGLGLTNRPRPWRRILKPRARRVLLLKNDVRRRTVVLDEGVY